MRHPEWPGDLHVGCVCAEKLSDDYLNPRKRENELKNKSSRRKNFKNDGWRFNPEKNSYTKKYKGCRITMVNSKYGNWGIFFGGNSYWNDTNGNKIKTFEQAEDFAFEQMISAIPEF